MVCLFNLQKLIKKINEWKVKKQLFLVRKELTSAKIRKEFRIERFEKFTFLLLKLFQEWGCCWLGTDREWAANFGDDFGANFEKLDQSDEKKNYQERGCCWLGTAGEWTTNYGDDFGVNFGDISCLRFPLQLKWNQILSKSDSSLIFISNFTNTLLKFTIFPLSIFVYPISMHFNALITKSRYRYLQIEYSVVTFIAKFKEHSKWVNSHWMR